MSSLALGCRPYKREALKKIDTTSCETNVAKGYREIGSVGKRAPRGCHSRHCFDAENEEYVKRESRWVAVEAV